MRVQEAPPVRRQQIAGKTAIKRSRLSAPAKWLLDHGLLEGRILDFGCGRGDLKLFLDGDIEQYDPNWHPTRPRGKFDVVVCIYVLNVLRGADRMNAISDARSFTRKDGQTYFAVRRDIKNQGVRSGGTEQFDVKLRFPSLFKKAGAFEIYHCPKN